MPVKKKKPVIGALVLVVLLVTLGFGFYIKKSRVRSPENIKPQTVRKQVGSIRNKEAVKQRTPTTSHRLSRKPAQKKETKISTKPVERPSAPLFSEKTRPGKAIDYEAEMAKLNGLIKLNDKDADAFYNRAWLYDSRGKLKMAEKDYAKAIELNKQNADAYFNRGLVFVKMKNYKQAVQDFSETIKLEPRAVDALCNRGNVNFQMGKMDIALGDFNAALQIDPKDADLYYNRAVVYLTKGDKSDSMTDFKKAASLGHSKAREYLNLPPVEEKKAQAPVKTASLGWGIDPGKVKIPAKTATGKIHGEDFTVESAKLEKGILTLRQGKQVFPDYAVMIFLFAKKDEKLEGKTYKISKNQGLGVPPIHMKWKKEGSDVPETEIFMKNYSMLLQFEKMKRDLLTGKIYLSLPDELKSFVMGTFSAKVQ